MCELEQTLYMCELEQTLYIHVRARADTVHVRAHFQYKSQCNRTPLVVTGVHEDTPVSNQSVSHLLNSPEGSLYEVMVGVVQGGAV